MDPIENWLWQGSKAMQRRSKVQSRIQVLGLLTLWVSALVSTTLGEEFRVQIPALAGAYPYGQSRGPLPFDTGCYFASVKTVRLEFTGSYSMGWFDGDDIENFYHGPMGTGAWFELNHGAPWNLRWFGSVHFGTNGPFSCTLTFQPSWPKADWQFLENGSADLYAQHEYAITAGWGAMSIPPQLTVSSVTLVVEGERMFKILSLSRDGTLCWSRMPAPGVIRVYSAPELTGPWSIVATTPSSNTCCKVALSPGGSTRYLRAVYSDQ